MISVCKLHNQFIQPGGNLSFVKWALENPNCYASKKFNQISYSTTAEKMWSSIIEFANRSLEPFDFEEAKSIFENPKSFDISSLGNKKTTLFLNVSDTDRTFDKLVNIFYTQALQILCGNADARSEGRLKVPVRIIMDDFAASAKIPDFDKIISVIRSRDISVSIILQSMTQLEAMYNHAEATTIINNCDHILYLGSQDLQTAEFIGNRIFKTSDTVLCMPRNKAILITTGEKAVTVDKIPPYSTLKSDKTTIKEVEKKMYNIKILNEAVSSIIAIADNVSDDRRERSKVYHLLKFVRAAVRDFPQNTNGNTADLLNAYAAKIKRFTDGRISRTAIVKRNNDNEIDEIVPLPITNAHDAIVYMIRKNLRSRNRDNYSAVHKIADLYMHRFFEYSDYVDNHPDIEDWEFKQTLLTAFCAEVGLHIGWLEKAMRFEEIPYDEIIV